MQLLLPLFITASTEAEQMILPFPPIIEDLEEELITLVHPPSIEALKVPPPQIFEHKLLTIVIAVPPLMQFPLPFIIAERVAPPDIIEQVPFKISEKVELAIKFLKPFSI